MLGGVVDGVAQALQSSELDLAQKGLHHGRIELRSGAGPQLLAGSGVLRAAR